VLESGDKEPQVPPYPDDRAEVLHQARQPCTQAVLLFPLASHLRDGLGMLAELAQAVAEVGFFLDLLVIEGYESAPQQDCTDGTDRRINEGGEEQPGGDEPEDPGERRQRQDAIEE